MGSSRKRVHAIKNMCDMCFHEEKRAFTAFEWTRGDSKNGDSQSIMLGNCTMCLTEKISKCSIPVYEMLFFLWRPAIAFQKNIRGDILMIVFVTIVLISENVKHVI